MKFSYIALNSENQKLTGMLSAETEAEAREQLHALSLSIVELQKEAEDAIETESALPAPDIGIKTFAFHVLGSKNNDVHGTIDAPDRKTALHRLMTEYKFQVISLCEATIPEEMQEEEGKQGLKELREEIEDEFGISQDKLFESKFEFERHTSDALEEQRKEIVKNVEEIVARAEEILKKFDNELTGDEVHSIRIKIDTLMRIRLSNNLKYIQDLADELLVQVDTTLQQHLETVNSNIQKGEGGGGVVAEELQKESGRIAYLRDITQRMSLIMDGYQTSKKRRFRRKKKQSEVKKPRSPILIKIGALLSTIRKMLSVLQRIILTKNTLVRKQYINQFVGHVREFMRIAKTPVEEFVPDELLEAEKANLAEKHKQWEDDLLAQEGGHFARFLQEARLFFGWLLAFYVVYFYFSVFALVKFGTDLPYFAFIYRSLNSAFPFLVTTFFFLMFIGITICLRLLKGKVLYSSLCLVCSFLSVIFVFANF